MELDDRAWVVVTETHLSKFAPNNEIFIDFLLTNAGKTPAHGLAFKRFFSWRKPSLTDLTKLEDSYTGDSNLAPGEKRTQRFTVTPAINRKAFEAITGGTVTFSVLGEFVYRDVFSSEQRSTPVCVYYEARAAPLLSGCALGQREMK
jgi:hypothetical protein